MPVTDTVFVTVTESRNQPGTAMIMNIPVSAYRIQLNAGFPFDALSAAADYLAQLGVSHVYASPLLQAKKGSRHGYDVVDPARINPELGGREKFDSLRETLKQNNLGWIQDIVPNHMAFDNENAMLMDVLERGSHSGFYEFFDVNWNHPYENLRGKILSPFLGSIYNECLNNGEISLVFGPGGFFIRYYELKLPAALSAYGKILDYICGFARKNGAADPEALGRLGELKKAFGGLADKAYSPEAVGPAKELLRREHDERESLRDIFARALAGINGQKGRPESFDFLHEILTEQNFRLSFWKVGNDELNYRRFFTINGLVCLNTDNARVFDHTHALIFQLLAEGKIDGLRIDHVDGLYTPVTYLRKLREKAERAYIAVEKILAFEEELYASWPVQGSTGYDFLNFLNGVFIDKNNERVFSRIYISFSEMTREFETLVSDKKRLFMGKHMAGDIDNLAHLLKHVIHRSRRGADFTLYGLRRALVEIMAHFPVYRTYAADMGVSGADRFYIKKAVEKARRSNQELFFELNFIEQVLLSEFDDKISEEEKEGFRHFTKRFQQFSGPLMAKGAEDTAFYIYNRLISLNEVGGFPERFGISLDEFHAYNAKKAAKWPHSLNTLSTHDTKRGEDIRARINVLSELPLEWQEALRRWHKLNRPARAKIENRNVPDKNDEYFIYQTLLGGFPFDEAEAENFKERMKEYVVKAVREAKVYTAWLKPDTKYEEGCVNFIEKILAPAPDNAFYRDFTAFQKKIAYFGVFNSLSQTLLKMTAPGIPDIYQGTELWDFNLVDPDNRRVVDFSLRRRMLERIKAEESPERIRGLLARPQDGAVKLFLIHKILEARRRWEELFRSGDYLPLETTGHYREHVAAFARRIENTWAVSAAPRLLAKISGAEALPLGKDFWRDTAVTVPADAPRQWQNVITSQRLERQNGFAAGDLFRDLPAVLLISTDGTE